jgi:hypothetical protein
MVVLVLSVASCGQSNQPIRTLTEDDVKQAALALEPIKAQLKQALVTSMQEDGPVKAMDACALKAPEIISEAANAGLEVGRTSHKLRNQTNAAEGSLATWLKFHEQTPSPGLTHAEITEDGKVLYAEPLFVAPLCLTCHGENISAEVQKELDRLYPADHAIDFKENDFRGLIWIKM